MNIPLDRLYDYIDNLTKKIRGTDLLIYRFNPHGSKNLKDLTISKIFSQIQWPIKTFEHWEQQKLILELYCHDQEPLCYDLYEQQLADLPLSKFQTVRQATTGIDCNIHSNFRMSASCNDLALLLHSEKRSAELEKYQTKNFVPVYYWSHALIARDWFRFAQHMDTYPAVEKIFLIYNRAWSGTREYRLKFADQLIQHGIHHHCKTTVNAIDPETNVHYLDHKFNNTVWQPLHRLEDYYDSSNYPSTVSAEIVIDDYEKTQIEVVLETLFDDTRLHLTEKSLRPIACGHPFLLAGTAGSLEYLRSYGFKTFGDIWNEDYDLIQDPVQRLQAIVDEMKSISQWSPQILEEKMYKAGVIADYNKKHFFSQEFFNQIVSELKQNFQLALEYFDTYNSYSRYINQWNTLLQYPQIQEFLKNDTDPSNPGFDYIMFTLDQLNKKK